MEKELLKGAIGTVGGYELDLKGRMIVADAKIGLPVVKIVSGIEIDLVEVLKLMKQKIPGTIDDAVIDVAIGVIEKL